MRRLFFVEIFHESAIIKTIAAMNWGALAAIESWELFDFRFLFYPMIRMESRRKGIYEAWDQ